MITSNSTESSAVASAAYTQDAVQSVADICVRSGLMSPSECSAMLSQSLKALISDVVSRRPAALFTTPDDAALEQDMRALLTDPSWRRFFATIVKKDRQRGPSPLIANIADKLACQGSEADGVDFWLLLRTPSRLVDFASELLQAEAAPGDGPDSAAALLPRVSELLSVSHGVHGSYLIESALVAAYGHEVARTGWCVAQESSRDSNPATPAGTPAGTVVALGLLLRAVRHWRNALQYTLEAPTFAHTANCTSAAEDSPRDDALYAACRQIDDTARSLNSAAALPVAAASTPATWIPLPVAAASTDYDTHRITALVNIILSRHGQPANTEKRGESSPVALDGVVLTDILKIYDICDLAGIKSDYLSHQVSTAFGPPELGGGTSTGTDSVALRRPPNARYLRNPRFIAVLLASIQAGLPSAIAATVAAIVSLACNVSNVCRCASVAASAFPTSSWTFMVANPKNAEAISVDCVHCVLTSDGSYECVAALAGGTRSLLEVCHLVSSSQSEAVAAVIKGHGLSIVPAVDAPRSVAVKTVLGGSPSPVGCILMLRWIKKQLSVAQIHSVPGISSYVAEIVPSLMSIAIRIVKLETDMMLQGAHCGSLDRYFLALEGIDAVRQCLDLPAPRPPWPEPDQILGQLSTASAAALAVLYGLCPALQSVIIGVIRQHAKRARTRLMFINALAKMSCVTADSSLIEHLTSIMPIAFPHLYPQAVALLRSCGIDPFASSKSKPAKTQGEPPTKKQKA